MFFIFFDNGTAKCKHTGSEAEPPPQIPIEVVVHDDSPKNTEGSEFMSNIIKRLYSGMLLNLIL